MNVISQMQQILVDELTKQINSDIIGKLFHNRNTRKRKIRNIFNLN